jgi:transposase
VICRDRSGCYADGGTRGAPDAIQVADRWHLWHNLGEAAERAVARHRGCLRVPAPASAAGPAGDARPPGTASTGQPRSGRVPDRTRQRHAAIQQLLADGRSIRAICAELDLARTTVRRFARAADPEELLVNDGTGRRPSILAESGPCLIQRWNDGCTDAALLWREIRDRGYPGGYSHVRDYLAPLRTTTIAAARPPAPPNVREVTSWIMTRPRNLAPGEQARLAAILSSCPELTALSEHVRAFAQIMTERRGRDLETWMTAATASGQPDLRSFVTGLRRDQDAVTAGLTLPWNSGVVEGHVNRIKMLKRQMYGRANPALLRRRVLLAD